VEKLKNDIRTKVQTSEKHEKVLLFGSKSAGKSSFAATIQLAFNPATIKRDLPMVSSKQTDTGTTEYTSYPLQFKDGPQIKDLGLDILDIYGKDNTNWDNEGVIFGNYLEGHYPIGQTLLKPEKMKDIHSRNGVKPTAIIFFLDASDGTSKSKRTAFNKMNALYPFVRQSYIKDIPRIFVVGKFYDMSVESLRNPDPDDTTWSQVTMQDFTALQNETISYEHIQMNTAWTKISDFFTSVIQERFDDTCAVYPLFNLKSTEISNYQLMNNLHRELPLETALNVIDVLLFANTKPNTPIIQPVFWRRDSRTSSSPWIPNFEYEKEDVIKPDVFYR